MSAQQLKQLVDQPLWSKQVVLWIGERSRLDAILQGRPQRQVDVLDLIPDDDAAPVSPDERAERLRRRLDEVIRGLQPAGRERVVLRVRNAALLARLGVGLGPFFDRFAGSSTMTVLEVGPVKPVRLPDSVAATIRCDADWLANCFRGWLSRPEHLCVDN